MIKLQKEDLEQRYLLLKNMLAKGMSLNIIGEIGHLFKPMTREEAGEKGQRMAEKLAEEINQLLNDTISEEQLIQKATEIQKKILGAESLMNGVIK